MDTRRAPSDRQLPPHDQEAEERLLGALLMAGSAAAQGEGDVRINAAVDEAMGQLKPEDFFRSWHGAVFLAIARCREEGAWGLVAVQERLERGNAFATAQDRGDLVRFVNLVERVWLLDQDAHTVKMCAVRRGLLALGERLERDAERAAPESTIEAAQQTLARLAGRLRPATPRHIGMEIPV